MAVKKQLPLQAQIAHQKVYMETKVTYIDPDFTAAQDLKKRTVAANAKFNQYLEEQKQIEEEGFSFDWDAITGGTQS